MGKADPKRGRAPRPFLRRHPRGAALAVLVLLLAATAEERTFGTISDEQQMIYTAVAMTQTGELGIARGQLFMVHRREGDALAPYGMGQPLVEALPSLLAGGFERRFGPGASQTLFVALQVALVALAAWGAGLAALALGGGMPGFCVALFGTGLASPLWAYTGTGYAEALQGACLALAFAAAARAVRRGEAEARLAAREACAAGALAALSVLAKSLDLVVAPLLLAPLLLDGAAPRRERVRLMGWAAAGAAPVLAAWLALEVVRFGRPLAAYGGFGFTHPLLDGLWRLTVGPDKGLLLYFPLAALSAIGVARLTRQGGANGSALGIGGAFVVLLVLTAMWWAWDGTVGWGPRLLVPVVPLLAAAAGLAVGPAPARVFRLAAALLVAGVLVNALGVFQSEAAAAAYLATLPPVPLGEREASAYPAYFLGRDASGRATLPRQFAAALDPGLSPLRVHLFLLRARLFGNDRRDVERRLSAPPWITSRPELVPNLSAPTTSLESLALYEKSPLAWPHLGAAMGKPRDERAEAFATAWDAALADQVLRALDVGQKERALALAERLLDVTPSGYTAALYAECLRALGRRETLRLFISSLPKPFLSSPSLGVVEGLAARDTGDEAAARRVLGEVAKVFPRPGISRALAAPMADWPASLHAMTGENLADRPLGVPRFGAK
jgi:hypothetical protein